MGNNIKFDIVGSFDEANSFELDAQRLVNLYVHTDPTGKNGKALFSTPGLNLSNGIKFNIDGVGRRIYAFGGLMYAVIGEYLYAIDLNLTHIKLGKLETDSGYVGMADNGKEMLVVDGNKGYVWNTTTSMFSVVSSIGFPSRPTDVAVLGNRFLVSSTDSARVYYSDVDDATSWNAINFFSINSQPDIVVGLSRLNDRLFVFGERVTEVWYDTGSELAVFERSDALSYGCISPGSVSTAFGMLIWVSKTDHGTGSVVLTTGVEPNVVSTRQIDKELGRYSKTDDSFAFIYRNEDGHIIYQISFTTENKTWCYDAQESRWFQLDYNATDRHLAQDHTYFNGKHYVLDYKAPHLYDMSIKYCTDNGVTVRRLRVTPPLYDQTDKYISLNSLLCDVKQGYSLDGVQIGSDAKLRLRVSKDGGIHYGNELSVPIGKLGNRVYTTQFFRLGRARDFVFEFKYDDPTPFVFLSVTANIDVQREGL